MTIKEFSAKHKLAYQNNINQIREYNAKVIPNVSLTATIILFIAFIASFFIDAMVKLTNLYLICAIISFLIYRLGKVKSLYNHTAALLYVQFALLAYLVFTISIKNSTNYPAGMALVIIAIFPIVFADRLYRISLATILMFLFFTYFTLKYKDPSLANVDVVNGFFSCIIGLFLANVSMKDKLNSFEYKRKLINSLETDALTGLWNRHKLFEIVKRIDVNKDLPIPSGVIMLDIDFFKHYNDKYGHLAGDECLASVARAIKETEKTYELKFFRFGGEEFCCFVWHVSKEKLDEIARVIQEKASSIKLKEQITVSLGYSYVTKVSSYEKVLEEADKALYYAKEHGRNSYINYASIEERN